MELNRMNKAEIVLIRLLLRKDIQKDGIYLLIIYKNKNPTLYRWCQLKATVQFPISKVEKAIIKDKANQNYTGDDQTAVFNG